MLVAHRCLSAFSVPKASATLTYVNKRVGSKSSRDEQIFEEVYDAVDHELRGWDASQKVDADRVHYSDVVVVEFYIRRFKIKPKDSDSKTADGAPKKAAAKQKTQGNGRDAHDPPRRWVTWGVSFDLLRVALIAEGVPGGLNEPLPESAGVI